MPQFYLAVVTEKITQLNANEKNNWEFLVEKELESCRLLILQWTPETLLNKCACRDTGKSTYQLLDFSSLTKNCQTTNATILSSCGNWKDHKNQQTGKYI